MSRTTNLRTSLVMAVFLMTMVGTAAGDVIYVDDDASIDGNGQNWATPYRYLQEALTAAVSGVEIRVAQGVYTPVDPLQLHSASNPNPANGERYVSRTADLSWTAGEEATSHDVYFGTNSQGVFQGNQSDTTFDPGTMAYSTTYYWRIDEVAGSKIFKGDLWSFTTSPDPSLFCVSLWKFDEAGGTTAYDSAGENHGAVHKAKWTTGQVGSALSFDRYGEYVSVPDDPSLNITGDITISAWVYLTEGSSYKAIVTKCMYSGPRNNPFDFRTSQSAEPRLALVRADAIGHERLYSNHPLSLHNWHHVLVKVHNKVPDFYVDGILTGKWPDIPFTKTPTGNTYPLLIGARDDGMHFHGKIDEVSIYKRALSAEEILELFWTGIGNKAFAPHPANVAISVSITADLSWTAGTDVTSHDVYFGTTSPPPFAYNQTATTFDPGTMDYSTTYYWRIDEVSEEGKTTGAVWSFTTVGSGPSSLPPSPPDLSVPPPPLGRTVTFRLKNDVVIKGGYAGIGKPDPNARDIDRYKTILSGDMNGNDVEVNDPCDLLTEPSRAENSYHVVTGSDCNESAVLDGFTITAGNANGEGSPFHQGSGGGIQIRFSTMGEEGPVLTNCTFIRNSARWGGGMDNDHSSTTLTNCTFSENFADWGGGGIGNAGYQAPKLVNCTFTANHAGNRGGAVANGDGRSTMENCTLIANHAELGGAIYNGEASATLTNCTLIGNSAERGGAVYNNDGGVKMTNCLVSENSCTEEGGVVYLGSDDSTILTNCILTANSAEKGGVVYVGDDSYARLTNCTVTGNRATDNGGALYFDGPDHATITNCILWNNIPQEIYPDLLGNEIVITYNNVQGGWPGTGNIDADPCFVETVFFDPISYWKLDEAGGTTAYDSVGQNHGTVYGAQWTSGQVSSALDFNGVDDYVRTANNVFTNAQLASGATLSAWFNTDSTAHSYIADNEGYLTLGVNHIYAPYPNKLCGIVDGGHNRFFSSSDVTDNLWHHAAIVWDGTDTAILYLDGVNVSSGHSGPPTPDLKTRPFTIGAHSTIAAYFNGLIDEVAIYDRALSDEGIQQHYLSGLNGQAYPDANTPDFHLLLGSPCINTGDPNYIAEPDETDLDGKPRIIGGRIDMGVYEFNHTPVADAGPDRAVEAQGHWGATVTLDGSGSSDADSTPGTNDDINDFNWYELDPCDQNADIFLGSGPIIDCNLSIGEHIIVLEVTDRIGAFDSKDVTITVQDTTPPDFELSVSPTMLWPPDHKMVLITPSWTVSDECDATPDVSLVSIVANEGDETIGDGHTSNDIQIGA
ncbi:MAG: LamG-like jellyroll fold domain-containing protein, partial [Planctomycetota bacterium]